MEIVDKIANLLEKKRMKTLKSLQKEREERPFRDLRLVDQNF